jgi:hypothetical protein
MLKDCRQKRRRELGSVAKILEVVSEG